MTRCEVVIATREAYIYTSRVVSAAKKENQIKIREIRKDFHIKLTHNLMQTDFLLIILFLFALVRYSRLS